MIKINGVEFTSREKLGKMVYENLTTNLFIDSIDELNSFLKLKTFSNLTKELFLQLCKFSFIYKRKLVSIIMDLDDINETFNVVRYEEYLKFRKKNKYSNTLESYILKYGEERGLRIREKSISNTQIKSPYNIEHWLNKGFSVDEAKEKISEYKKNKATSLDGFIKRHGFVDGVKKFDVFKKTSKHTKDKYIETYGEKEGNIKWDEYIIKKGSKSVFKKDYWLNKGFNEIEAEKKRKEFHKERLNTSSVKYWINKGLTEDEAAKKIEKIFEKKQVKFRRASKQSLNIFKPVIDTFNDLDYRIGVDDNNELNIYDKKMKRHFYYDFTIPSLKLIFEYHGEKYHPHFSIKSEEDLIKWKTINVNKYMGGDTLNKLNGVQVRKKDEYKKQLAIDNGYKYFVIWSSDDKKQAIKNIINIINITKDENKKNN